jgi:hypothetical protein
MNAYKKKLAEAYGYADDSRSFEEVYGDKADSLFEGYEVPDKFRKLFEAEKAKNARLVKRLKEGGELIARSSGSEARKSTTEKYRKAGRESMLKSIGEENYEKLFESKKLCESTFGNDAFDIGDESEYDDWDNDWGDDDEDFGEDAMGLADSFEDEDEPDWDDGPSSYDDFDFTDKESDDFDFTDEEYEEGVIDDLDDW